MKTDDDLARTSQPSSADGPDDDLASMFEARSHARARRSAPRTVVVVMFAIAGGLVTMIALSGRVPQPPGIATTRSELAGAPSSPELPSVSGSTAVTSLSPAEPPRVGRGGDSIKPQVAGTAPTPSPPAPAPEKSAPGSGAPVPTELPSPLRAEAPAAAVSTPLPRLSSSRGAVVTPTERVTPPTPTTGGRRAEPPYQAPASPPAPPPARRPLSPSAAPSAVVTGSPASPEVVPSSPGATTVQTLPRDAVDFEAKPRHVWSSAAAPSSATLTSVAMPSAAEKRPSRIKTALRHLSPVKLWRIVRSKIHALPRHERGPASDPNAVQGP